MSYKQSPVNIRKQKGFTLIELLVVIAIIALLVAILMPALKKVQQQAKAVICRSRLHQWGIYFWFYANDNNGSFNCWDEDPTGYYVHALRPYHKSDYELLCCPVVPKEPVIQGADYMAVGGARSNWGFKDPQPKPIHFFRAGDYGSYGQNTWTVNP